MPIRPEALTLITKIQNNRTLFVGLKEQFLREEIIGILDSLSRNRSVKHFTFYPANLMDATRQPMIEMLQQNEYLESLQMGDESFIDNDKVIILSDILKASRAENISLSGCAFESQDNLHLLMKSLSENPFTKSLSLSECYISANSLSALLQDLKSNQSLEILNLERCNINAKSASQIAETLKENRSIKNLALGYNPIGSGAAALADMLKFNSSLEDLSLERCYISPEEALYFADAFKGDNKNKTLISLNLAENPIYSDGGIHMASIIGNSKSLKKLDINNCDIGEEAAEHLAQSIRNSKSLLCLNISKNPINFVGLTRLVDALTINNSLTDFRINNCYQRSNPRNHDITIQRSLYDALHRMIDGNICLKYFQSDFIHEEIKEFQDRNLAYPEQIAEKILEVPQANLDDLELKFISNGNHPENCLSILERALETHIVRNLENPPEIGESEMKDFFRHINSSNIGSKILLTARDLLGNSDYDLLKPGSTFSEEFKKMDLAPLFGSTGVAKNIYSSNQEASYLNKLPKDLGPKINEYLIPSDIKKPSTRPTRTTEYSQLTAENQESKSADRGK